MRKTRSAGKPGKPAERSLRPALLFLVCGGTGTFRRMDRRLQAFSFLRSVPFVSETAAGRVFCPI